MNMFARFDEIPTTFQDIKETKRYGWTHTRPEGQHENSIPPTNTVACGGKIILTLTLSWSPGEPA